MTERSLMKGCSLVFSVDNVTVFQQLFGNIAIEEEDESAINQHNNFRTFIQALMLLFRWLCVNMCLYLHLCIYSFCLGGVSRVFESCLKPVRLLGVQQERRGTRSCWHVWGVRSVTPCQGIQTQSVAASLPTSTSSPSSSSVPSWWVHTTCPTIPICTLLAHYVRSISGSRWLYCEVTMFY